MMKQFFNISVAALLIFLLGCRASDSQNGAVDPVQNADPVLGKWFWNKKIITSGKDGSVLLDQQVTACERQSFKEFLNSKTVNVEEYQSVGTQCSQLVSSSGLYSYDQPNKKLTITLGAVSTTYNILVWTASELQMDYGMMDYNNDGFSDKLIYSYTK